MRIRLQLVILVLGTLIPILAFSGVTVVLLTPPRSWLGLLLLVGAASTLLGVLAALRRGRHIASGIGSLSVTAAAFARGERVDVRRSGIVEVDQVAEAMRRASEERHQREAAVASLDAVGRLISESLDAREVSQRIVDTLRTLLAASHSALYQLDPDTGALTALATAGVSGPGLPGVAIIPAGVGAAGLAVSQRQGIVTADVLEDPRISFTPDFRGRVEQAGYRAVLSVPLVVRGQVIGAIGVGDRAGRVFDSEDVRIAQAFADQAAIAIANARLHGEIEERLMQSETLLAVAQQVSGTLDVTEMMRRVAREAGRALGADMVGAFLATADHRALMPLAGYRVPRHLLPDFQTFAIPLEGHRFLEEAWERRQPVSSSDVASDSRVDQATIHRFPHRSNLFCPMIVQGEPIGGLFVIWFEAEHRCAPAELQLMEGISRQAGIALANARLVQELKRRQMRLEALVTVDRQLARIQPVHALLARIAGACGELFDANSVDFSLVEGQELVPCGTWGPIEDLLPSSPLRIGEGLTGAVAASGEALVIRDPLGDPRIDAVGREAYRRLGLRAFLGVPVTIDDRIAGVLTVRTCRDEGFLPEDVDVARAFAAQAAIALENSRLYQESQRALDELKHTQQQLTQAQKMEAIGQLAGGIAHDFNNLLTVIGGRSRLLLRRLPEGDPARGDIELIEKTSHRAATLTRQLLAFSRKQVLQPRSLDLNALVGELAPMLARLIGEHIELSLVPGSGVGPVLADPGQLEQVVMNLVVNARDAMPRGGRLRIETESRVLHTAVSHAQGDIPPNQYVALIVRDTGCGIDPTTMGRIFEPFFTTKEPGKGTGLGLSTAYGIVHQSGGLIGVDSTVGQGTTFTIYLPRIAAPAEVRPAPAGAESMPGGQETILLVEDDPEVCQLASEVLTLCGYRVLETGDPEEAVALASRHRDEIRVLVTDIVMPGLSGPALAARLVALYPEMRVLYMSGYTAGVLATAGVLELTGPLLDKPFTPRSLALRVRAVLDATLPAPEAPALAGR